MEFGIDNAKANTDVSSFFICDLVRKIPLNRIERVKLKLLPKYILKFWPVRYATALYSIERSHEMRNGGLK